MKNNTLTKLSEIKPLICNLIGHRFEQSKKVTNHFSEYQCKCCGKEMTEDTKGRLVSLTPELKDINETLQMIFNKRHTHA